MTRVIIVLILLSVYVYTANAAKVDYSKSIPKVTFIPGSSDVTCVSGADCSMPLRSITCEYRQDPPFNFQQWDCKPLFFASANARAYDFRFSVICNDVDYRFRNDTSCMLQYSVKNPYVKTLPKNQVQDPPPKTSQSQDPPTIKGIKMQKHHEILNDPLFITGAFIMLMCAPWLLIPLSFLYTFIHILQ